jgi:hypothetical protein
MVYETVIVQRRALLRKRLARWFDNSPFRVVASFPYLHGQVASVLAQQEPHLLLADGGGDPSRS